MVYAAALLVGLALLWLGWAPQPSDPLWLGAGGVGIGIAFALALLMRIVDSEGAPYLRAPGLLMAGGASARRIIVAGADLARRALATDPELHPALVQLKTRLQGDTARATLASLVALAPGAVIVDTQDDTLLVHALIEDDVDEDEMRGLERGLGGRRS